MENKLKSVHAINSDIDKVALCISNCQMRCEEIFYKKALFSETINFYIHQTNNIVSIYSDCFESEFSTKQIGHWFAGANTFVFLLDYLEGAYCKIELFRNYKFLTPLILIKEDNKINQQSLFKFNELSSLFEISESDLKVHFDSLEKYLQYYSSLFKIPFDFSLSDIIGIPEIEVLSFYR